MELKTYLRILFKYWWIVLPAFLITITATIVLTFNQTPIYKSTATFVVSPSAAFQDVRSFASGLDTLSKRVEIAATYGEVASSRTIKKKVIADLGLSSEQRQNLLISSKLLAGTNVLELTVEAQDPAVARDVANAVGTETIQYAQSLYEPYVLRPLDEATLRRTPIKPAKQTNIILGGIVGLVLGVGLAFLADYLSTPLETMMNLNVVDAKTGVYNKNYFLQRLNVEMARAKRQNYPLSVVLMSVDPMGALGETHSPGEESELLRKTAVVLKQHLREEDLIAYYGNATFAFLLPDMTGETAKAMIEKLQMRVSWTPFELERSGTTVNLNSVAGVATFDHDGTGQDELINRANGALHRAGTNGYSQTYLATKETISQDEQPA